MEQVQRRKTAQADEQVVDEVEVEDNDDRDATLAEIDEILDQIEEVIEDAQACNDQGWVAAMAGDFDPDAELHALGLYGPSDLDEEIAEELGFKRTQNPTCAVCGRCPALPGCPISLGDDFDTSFETPVLF